MNICLDIVQIRKKLVNNNTFEKPEILFINSIYYHLLDETDEKKIYIDKKKLTNDNTFEKSKILFLY